MLTSLTIKNFILIESLKISFGHKLTVLTGETGAGKSILLDAVSFVLGARTDTNIIKNTNEITSVSASFDIPSSHPAILLLQEQDLISNATSNIEIILRRSINKDGKNKAFINDIPVNLSTLKHIGDTLIEIHGQFDNQGLLNPQTHINILDNFASLTELKNECKLKYNEWQNAKTEFIKLQNEFAKAKEDEEYLKHNLNELLKLNYQIGEENELTEKRKSLNTIEKNTSSINDAFNFLNSYGDTPERFIQNAISALERINDNSKNESIKLIIEELETASSNLIDVYERLNQILNSTENITTELEKTENRLFLIKELSRKHNIQITDIPKFTKDLQFKVDNLNNSDILLKKQYEKTENLKSEYVKIATTLSNNRINAAKNLSNMVLAELPPLKLEKATFNVMVETITDEDKFTPSGINKVHFMGSTNFGGKTDYIHKIASGGELARFTLAIKVVLAKGNTISTFIFDEVDTGISGATASSVGERLAKLSNYTQTLVITHSPQVAAHANHHFKVSKFYDEEKNTTITSVDQLNNNEKIMEIARIISGDKITNEAISAATTLFNTSNKV